MVKHRQRSNIIYAINPAVDVYAIGDDVLEFYFINNRRRITMKVSSQVIVLIENIDGKLGIDDLCNSLNISDFGNVQSFVDYLYEQSILLIPDELEMDRVQLTPTDLERFDRQIEYFTSLYTQSGYKAQQRIFQQTVLIFGAGAIGAGIAMQLAMSGVRHFVLVDKDIITSDSMERHFFFRKKDIGRDKCEALAGCLKQIDSQVCCEWYTMVIDYDSDLTSLIEQSSFVVNTLDEPYIGLTSMKIGRACYALRKPLYVAGGFDAHLMSTGELIIPDETPCVDCYSTFFKKVLNDWNPRYNTEAVMDKHQTNEIYEVGGLASMALFSVSYAIMVILNYMVTGNSHYSKGRGELLFDQLHIEYLNVIKDPACHVCGNK